MNADRHQLDSPWPHRLALALVCVTFPLIWVGGLVTTYDAGMSVPDWPNTYGYNLFRYPLATWINGPWSLFIEHGHRLLGSLSGMITIGLVVSAWATRTRPLVRWLSLAALAGVIFQGLLGGLRVIEDKVELARIHGCVGPAFFAFAVALATLTSVRWQLPPKGLAFKGMSSSPWRSIERVAMLTTAVSYVQLVLGSFLRHLPVGSTPGDFRSALNLHLATAAALLGCVGALGVQTYRAADRQPWLARPALGLMLLVCVQLGLGAATYVAKYGWPNWLADFAFAAEHVVTAEGRPQAWLTTAHVATGSLIVATSLMLALRSARCAGGATNVRPVAPRLAEALA